MSEAEARQERPNGYSVLASGIEWRFGDGGEGSLSFDEIVADGPTAVLLFGVLAQLGALSRDTKASSRSSDAAAQASVAASHALVEVGSVLRDLLTARTEEGGDEKVLDRATSVLTQLSERFPGMFPVAANLGKAG